MLSSQRLSKIAITTTILFSSLAQAATQNLDLSNIETIFSFGDSLTTTGYDIYNAPQKFNTNLSTSAGQAWIQDLATKHTKASNSYYNFASLGATVDNAVVFSNGALDFVGQVGVFRQFFNSSTSNFKWSPSTSLFTIWFGSDDLYNLLAAGLDFKSYQSAIITALDNQVGQLYNMGASNVLFIDIPAQYRSPLANYTNSGAIMQDDVSYWNARIRTYAQVLAARYPNIQSYFVSSESLYNGILDDPSKYDFSNINTACSSYSQIVYDPTADDSASCGAPLAKYFWKDFWRPTFSVDSLLAENVASVLTKNTTTIGNNIPSNNPGLVAQGSQAASSALGPSPTASSGSSTAASQTSNGASIPQASGQGQNLSTSPASRSVVTLSAVLGVSMFTIALAMI